MRVLARLDEAQRRAMSKGDRKEIEICNVSWQLVYFAFFKNDPDPLRAAMDKLGIDQSEYTVCHNLLRFPFTLVMPPPRPAEITMVDGRNARQWVASIIHYLEWRAGQNWRRLPQRNDYEPSIYFKAIFEVNHAHHALPEKPPLPEPVCINQHKAFKAAA